MWCRRRGNDGGVSGNDCCTIFLEGVCFVRRSQSVY